MLRTVKLRLLTPTLGLVALTALSFSPARAQKVAVTLTDLTPSFVATDPYMAQVEGNYRNAQVGYSTTTFASDTVYSGHAVLWTGTAASAIDLHPIGMFNYSFALGVDSNTQVGYGTRSNSSGSHYHALLWHGTANSVIDLTPPGTDAYAVAVSGSTQVGSASPVINANTDGPSHAYLWHGTADSAVDLHPAGFDSSRAIGISGNIQAGYGEFNNGNGPTLHALLWHGSAASVMDLNPITFNGSFVGGVSGDTEVGGGYPVDEEDEGGSHALLWHGTANSVVDLHPSGVYSSSCNAVSGDTQVGDVVLRSDDDGTAYLWRGTADSALDLSQFLPFEPFGYGNGSYAESVDDHDGVVTVGGGAFDLDDNRHAILWRVVFAPTLQRISQTRRLSGGREFSLTTKGMRFTPQSFINWNGKRLPTTFQNSEHLQTVVPASLIAQPGTASVTVSTPGVDTSQSKTFTIE